jgi:hypothetical protein
VISATHLWLFSGNPALSSAQSTLLSDIFDIPGRWEAKVDEIDRIVMRRIIYLAEWTIQMMGGISEQGLCQIIDRVHQGLQDEWGESKAGLVAK